MKKETRTVVYDEGLKLEACRFEGIVQPFPNHFHEYYVIGFVEDGQRILSCRNREYTIEKGSFRAFQKMWSEMRRQAVICDLCMRW